MPPNPDHAFLHHLEGLPVSPVFITGPHRSGTTFLYSLLQATGRFTIVTAYHVLRHRELLSHHFAGTTDEARSALAAEFRADGLLDRVLDGVPVSPNMPEEYGFVLAQPGPGPIRRNNLDRFTTFCRKVQFIATPQRPLLLKNPWDFTNSLFIKQHIPGAKYLYLHRHPARTVNSQLRAARSMLAGRNAYVARLSPPYGRLFRRPLTLAAARLFWNARRGPAARLLASLCVRGIQTASHERSELLPADRFDVRYETLCTSPNETIAHILRWLGLSADSLPDFQGMVSPRGGPLLPEVDRWRAKLARRLSQYYEEFGYAAEA